MKMLTSCVSGDVMTGRIGVCPNAQPVATRVPRCVELAWAGIIGMDNGGVSEVAEFRGL